MIKIICFFTGTRAEYGLLRPVMALVRRDAGLQMQLLVSGAHLHAAFGATVQEIVRDGFTVDAQVPILDDDNDDLATCRAMSRCLDGCGRELERLRPDVLVVLGDRYETFAAVAAAAACRVPVAHLHGGELTEGVIDELFRHAITKMSHLHFTSTEEYRQRVIQLGERPERVFNVGSVGLESLRSLAPASDAAIVERLGFLPDRKTLLVTLHPEASNSTAPETLARELFAALDRCLERDSGRRILLTKSNADAGGRTINALLEEYAAERPKRTALFTSLGQPLYLHVLERCGVCLGNSSSGIIEAPGAGVPTVNIGARQQGRIRARSVLDVAAQAEAISAAVELALGHELQTLARQRRTPYEQPDTARTIVETIRRYAPGELLNKTFYDFSSNHPGLS